MKFLLGFVFTSAPFEAGIHANRLIDHNWNHLCNNKNRSEQSYQHLIFIVLLIPESVRYHGIEI
jgi:hypothetical protein